MVDATGLPGPGSGGGGGHECDAWRRVWPALACSVPWPPAPGRVRPPGRPRRRPAPPPPGRRGRPRSSSTTPTAAAARSTWPSTTCAPGAATVDLSGSALPGGTAGRWRLQALVHTLAQFPTVRRVKVEREGRAVAGPLTPDPGPLAPIALAH